MICKKNCYYYQRSVLKKPKNEFEVFAKNWAFKLEKMRQDQNRFAKKFINNI